jgi:hypothetical protein
LYRLSTSQGPGWRIGRGSRDRVAHPQKSAYEWLRRFAAEGWDALLDRSSRPHHSLTATKPAIVERILRLCATRLAGPEIAPPRYHRETPGELGLNDTRALARYLYYFTTQRKHFGLRGQTLAQVL